MYGNKFDAQQEPTAQRATDGAPMKGVGLFGVETVAMALGKRMTALETLIAKLDAERERLLTLYDKTPMHLLLAPSSTVKSLSENL